MVRFEEIPDIIRSMPRNEYEVSNNIETGQIELIAGSEEELWGIWKGEKSDGTDTLYFSWCSKLHPDNWRYPRTPTKEHLRGFEQFIKEYWKNEKRNTDSRHNRELAKYAKVKGPDTPLGDII